MDPARKRRIRLVVALSCALLLSGALVYTSFSASSEAVSPTQLAARATPGHVYQLTGKVAAGTWKRDGIVNTFQVEDRSGGGHPVAVRYVGAVPDPFREGREIIVDVERSGTTFVGQKDSLVTKCPSKFSADKKA